MGKYRGKHYENAERLEIISRYPGAWKPPKNGSEKQPFKLKTSKGNFLENRNKTKFYSSIFEIASG